MVDNPGYVGAAVGGGNVENGGAAERGGDSGAERRERLAMELPQELLQTRGEHARGSAIWFEPRGKLEAVLQSLACRSAEGKTGARGTDSL
jgi:hypothetical protein